MKNIIILTLLIFVFLCSKSVKAVTFTVCSETGAGCDHVGPTGIQQAVDEANNGDLIFIKAGKYFGPNNKPLDNKNCFVNLGAKNLTLKGEGKPLNEWQGTVLYGEGHDPNRAYTPPYNTRAGICSKGGFVTIDSIHIKEFEGQGLNFTNSRLILKNSIVDGNDSGGAILSNTSVLAVNNYFVANLGFVPFGQSDIKAVNNTFMRSNGLLTRCEGDFPSIYFVNNIVVDHELTIGAGGITSDCPATVTKFKNQHIVYNLIWKNLDNNNYPCYANHEYCDDYIGKKNTDPMLHVPAIDQRGWRWDGDLSPQAGSPVIGAGDPSVPGTKDLGATGGPCVDPVSTNCQQFIATNQPPELQPPEPPQPPGNGNNDGGGYATAYIPKNLIYDFNHTFKSVFNLPDNFGLPSTASATTKEAGIGLIMYIVFAAIYIMFIHFAVGIKSEFNLFLMVIYFALGGIIGGWLHTYEAGLIIAIILSLIFF